MIIYNPAKNLKLFIIIGLWYKIIRKCFM